MSIDFRFWRSLKMVSSLKGESLYMVGKNPVVFNCNSLFLHFCYLSPGCVAPRNCGLQIGVTSKTKNPDDNFFRGHINEVCYGLTFICVGCDVNLKVFINTHVPPLKTAQLGACFKVFPSVLPHGATQFLAVL